MKDPRDLICTVCGKSYHVDYYDPDAPCAVMCIECFKKMLKEEENS